MFKVGSRFSKGTMTYVTVVLTTITTMTLTLTSAGYSIILIMLCPPLIGRGRGISPSDREEYR